MLRYYFQRKQALKRSLQRSHSEDSSDEEGIPVKVSQQCKNDSASSSKLHCYNDEGSTSSNVHENASNGDSGSFLQGISIHLYNFAPDEQRTLTRQIISADGDVHATVEQGTNYIVVSGYNINHEELEVYKNDFEETAIVMREWLVKSIENKTLLDTAKFVLEI